MNGEATAVTVVGAEASMSLKQVTDRVNLVHEVLKKVMKEGTHYGKVPGCGNKMVLLKPGADLLAMTFRLVPRYQVTRTDMGGGHREYEVTCSMHSPNGELLGQGVGSASTMEKKYRYRYEGEGKDRVRIENEDIADCYNTVLKISKKRSHIDTTLTVTGAADLFTQDLIDEDGGNENGSAEPLREPKAKSSSSGPIEKPAETNTVTGKLDTVSVKNGAGKKGPWTKYGLKVNGEWYGTFDGEVGKAAETLKGQQVTVTWAQDGKYMTAKGVVAAGEGQGEVPKKDAPSGDDRDALVMAVGVLIDKLPASKIESAMKAVGLSWTDGDEWDSLGDEQLVTLRSLLTAAK